MLVQTAQEGDPRLVNPGSAGTLSSSLACCRHGAIEDSTVANPYLSQVPGLSQQLDPSPVSRDQSPHPSGPKSGSLIWPCALFSRCNPCHPAAFRQNKNRFGSFPRDSVSALHWRRRHKRRIPPSRYKEFEVSGEVVGFMSGSCLPASENRCWLQQKNIL
jgi:hypothetical protein